MDIFPRDYFTKATLERQILIQNKEFDDEWYQAERGLRILISSLNRPLPIHDMIKLTVFWSKYSSFHKDVHVFYLDTT